MAFKKSKFFSQNFVTFCLPSNVKLSDAFWQHSFAPWGLLYFRWTTVHSFAMLVLRFLFSPELHNSTFNVYSGVLNTELCGIKMVEKSLILSWFVN